MKVIAMYLPQFHRTVENDKWWGEGFTDWVSTRKAVPLFDGHYQPHIPFHNNYYDLADTGTLRWQSELMLQYSVDGLCFYHYYFENGRKILEKPSELLLRNKDINMPFCFCWANESWARSWSGIIGANAWNESAENDKKNDKRTNGMLLKQAYGKEKDWEQHFYYLLPFFKDERYLRQDNKPIFIFYRANLIDCLPAMTECWQKLAKVNGLNGIYFIANNIGAGQQSYIQAQLYHEPVKSNTYFIENQFDNREKHISYDRLWERILETPLQQEKVYYGGFVSYDDTPRRKQKGIVVTGAVPEKFGYYLTKLMAKNKKQGNEITFINAWNEWGEGMHLEPDEKFGYGFLEQILLAKKNYEKEVNNIEAKEYSSSVMLDMQKRTDKFEMYLNDMDMWMSLKEHGINISDFFRDSDINNVGIYGYGIMGRHLIEELNKSFKIIVIDKQRDKICCDYPVYLPEECPKVDVIIVASYFYMEQITYDMNTDIKLISLGDIIHQLWSKL